MRVIIAHGWDGYPEEGWFPWLKKELEKKGFEVLIPQLPDAANPKIQNWVPALAKAAGTPDKETYFVGHSMGCQTIARFLEKLPAGAEIGGAVFVAGFFKHLTNMEDDDVKEIARHWLTAPIDFKKVRLHLNRSVAIFSDNDPYVPLDNQDDFKSKLGSDIIIEHKQGHFSGSTGTFKVPSVLESVLKLSRK
jgi:predicted alpha/beta hydrolase family esterase